MDIFDAGGWLLSPSASQNRLLDIPSVKESDRITDSMGPFLQDEFSGAMQMTPGNLHFKILHFSDFTNTPWKDCLRLLEDFLVKF